MAEQPEPEPVEPPEITEPEPAPAWVEPPVPNELPEAA